MKFGVCTSIAKSNEVADTGWDYVEASVGSLLQGLVPDAEWTGAADTKGLRVPVLACNSLVPGELKITGPNVDTAKLREYMSTVLRRAGQLGIQYLVFGSGGARNVPDGFDRGTARQQIASFARMSAEIAEKHNVTLVAEPLNRKECNIVNTVEEAMVYVKDVNHPNFQCLVDSYHMWLEDEPLSNVAAAMPWIKHVHVADLHGRVAPGESGKSDYVEFFKVLKGAGYDGMISVEATQFSDIANQGPRVLEFLKTQWDKA